MANVRNFGATGDGNTDDTEAIRHAVVEGDGGLEFPRGDYRITGTIEIPLDQLGRTSIHGTLGVAKIIHAGPGPAFKFVGTHTGTASPLSVEPNVWANQRTPTVAHIEIEGRHGQADGITCDHTMQAIFDGVTVRNCRHGIHLIRRNRNVIVANCHLYHNRGAGLFLDGVNLHQINVVGCHISYNALGGIRVTESEIQAHADDRLPEERRAVAMGTFTAFFAATWLAAEGIIEQSPWLAMGATLGVAMLTSMTIAIILERVAYRPLRGAPRLVPLITAIGASLFLQYTFRGLYGAGVRAYPNFGLFRGSIDLQANLQQRGSFSGGSR
jgi:hypothetical protein